MSIAVQPDDQPVAARISACLEISEFHLDDLYLQLNLAKTEVVSASPSFVL